MNQGVTRLFCLGAVATIVALWPTARAQWIEFVDATASVLDAEQDLVADDLLIRLALVEFQDSTLLLIERDSLDPPPRSR